MRTKGADSDAFPQRRDPLDFSSGRLPNEWSRRVQLCEGAAAGAWRTIARATQLAEAGEDAIEGAGKFSHRCNTLKILRAAANPLMVRPMSAQLRDYDFELPAELIAQRPLPRREEARMMVLDRARQTIAHRRFVELPEFVRQNDLLVLNDSRVLPARRFSDDGAIEFLFLQQVDAESWRCLVKPGRKMRLGARVRLDGVTGRVEKIFAENGERLIRFEQPLDPYRGGIVPLPPYLRRESDAEDVERYQTVYARAPGAVAAPTAGLHFTPEILARLPHTFVTLHVGPGTFRPVQSEAIAEHRMHAERFLISRESAAAINVAERVLAVGTTSVRVLEAAQRNGSGEIVEQEGETDIFIRPPYRFRAVDLLLTNFHLPRSTLLMLVSAFAGREFVLAAYREAVRERYRFYSYGDCMLIL